MFAQCSDLFICCNKIIQFVCYHMLLACLNFDSLGVDVGAFDPSRFFFFLFRLISPVGLHLATSCVELHVLYGYLSLHVHCMRMRGFDFCDGNKNN